MKINALAVVTIVLGGLIAVSDVEGAKQLLPATEAVQDPLNIVAVVRVGERVAPDRYRFVEVAPVLGERPGPWVVRMSADLADAVDPEQEYVIAFTDWIPDPNLKTLPPTRDPEGFKLVSVSLVGECLIPAVEPVRELFLAPRDYFDQQREDAIDAALAALIQPAASLQKFGAGELALRLRLSESYQTHQQSLIRRFIDGTHNDTVARSTMLSASQLIPPQPKLVWLPMVSRSVISRINPVFAGDPNLPALAVAALRALGTRGTRDDCEVISPFLRSNQTGVADAALQALGKLHPKTAAREAQTALTEPDLPDQSRRNFETFLQQMNIRGIQELREQEAAKSKGTDGDESRQN
jgi:hypothetical protein